MSKTQIVTIDGPAASGKTSVSRELAARLGWNWVSTGAFYRGLAYFAQTQSLNLNDEAVLLEAALSTEWGVETDEEKTRVFIGPEDVTNEINREEVGSLASRISQFPKVRQALLNAQRRCAVGTQGLVAEGRDCGTVVFPQANVKFFLTARAEDRAVRRALEQGKTVSETQDAQKQRDHQDASRKAAPMQASLDSFTVDTSELNFLEVVDKVERIVRERLSAK
jgi:cytidylate kinase